MSKRRRSISRAVIRKKNNRMSREQHVLIMLDILMKLCKRANVTPPKRVMFFGKEYIIKQNRKK